MNALCGAAHGDLVCIRYAGHPGDHAALRSDPYEVVRWPTMTSAIICPRCHRAVGVNRWHRCDQFDGRQA